MTAPAVMQRVRVTVGDGWTPVHVDVGSDETIASVKGRALKAVHVTDGRGDAYEVKFGGAAVRDESLSLAAVGVPDGGALVVLPRRRRPVR